MQQRLMQTDRNIRLLRSIGECERETEREGKSGGKGKGKG